jgi:hypothetical protein
MFVRKEESGVRHGNNFIAQKKNCRWRPHRRQDDLQNLSPFGGPLKNQRQKKVCAMKFFPCHVPFYPGTKFGFRFQKAQRDLSSGPRHFLGEQKANWTQKPNYKFPSTFHQHGILFIYNRITASEWFIAVSSQKPPATKKSLRDEIVLVPCTTLPYGTVRFQFSQSATGSKQWSGTFIL